MDDPASSSSPWVHDESVVAASVALMVAGSLESWEYLASYSDLMNWLTTDTATAAWHYNTYGLAENRSISFDAWDYLASNPDLMNWLGADVVRATEHYILYGRYENRSFSFDASSYLAANGDLFNWLGTNYDAAAQHYIEHGRFEIAQGLRSSQGTPFDTISPTVLSLSPHDAASGVAVESTIVVTFSESIVQGTGAIALHTGSFFGPVVESFNVASSHNLSFSGSVLTINPSADLASNTHYFVTLDAGSVRDLAGNGYAGSADYDFMTTPGVLPNWDWRTGYGLLNVDGMLERATGHTISDAPLFGDGHGAKDWGLNQIHAPDAWSAGYTGKGVVVAVIDTGVDYTHPDLSANMWKNGGEIAGNGVDDDHNGYVDDVYGYDFVDQDGTPFDDEGHGTFVAGIIAGLHNGIGVTGVAPDAQIMAVRVLGRGDTTYEGVASGIRYAVDNGADVINLSLIASNQNPNFPSIAAAIGDALSHGVIVCMASGNEGSPTPDYPAFLAQTIGGIAVGAVDSTGSVASFSNGAGHGSPWDFMVAPGVGVYSTTSGDAYATMNGTSMATPYVSGAAALLLSAHADFSSAWVLEELENIMTMSASSLGTSALSVSPASSGADPLSGLSSSDALPGSLLAGNELESTPVSLVGIVV